MKKIITLLLVMMIVISSSSCGSNEKKDVNMQPHVSQMKAICELATMDCYYHNVAKIKEEDVEGILWWKKDKHFWIEYSGIATVGIDASLVNIEVKDENVTITMPPAKVLGCKVDKNSLTKDSYIVDKDSVDIKAEDQTEAFKEAQNHMEETVSADITLLENAKQRAQELLEEYVDNIGNIVGKQYEIEWLYVDENGEKLGTEEAKMLETE